MQRGFKLRYRRAFTLVELLIVVIIIAVLAAIAIQKFSNSSLRSREAALRAELKTLRNAEELIRGDTGCYPASFDAFTSTTAPATCIQPDGTVITMPAGAWRGPYVSNVGPNPVDGHTPGYTLTTSAGGNPVLGAIKADSGTAIDGSDYSSW